jgi:hypothetical protein
MKTILVAVVIMLALGVQQASAFTQFEFGKIHPVNGTAFSALVNNNGEYLEFVWTFSNGSYSFDKHTSQPGIWDGLDNSWNMSPRPDKFTIIDKLGMFSINGTILSGESVDLCINLNCNQTTVDTSGRAFYA